MYRKIYQQMLEWKQKSAGRTALLLEGARRVGKSYIAEEFAKKEYRSYILIDFAQVGKEIRDVFENQLADLDSFFRYLSGFYGVKLYPNESVFIRCRNSRGHESRLNFLWQMGDTTTSKRAHWSPSARM